MDEVKFALKLFIVSILIVMGLQVKIGQSTLEDRMETAFQSSWIAQPLQKVTDGAVLAIRNAMQNVSDYANKTVSGPEPQKASRIDFNLHRSQSVMENEKNKAAQKARAAAEQEGDDD